MGNNENKTILIVDDDKVNLLVAKKHLQEQYKTVPVNSGKQALTYLSKHTPDLVLLDVMMPELSGFAVMEIMQQDARLSRIPVVFLTADRTPENEAACLSMGAADYICKPFVPVVLKHRIERVLMVESARKLLEKKLEFKEEQLVTVQREIIQGLANIIESRDGTTGDHIKRTSAFVAYLVKKLKARGIYADILTEEYEYWLCNAAPMHDIGKITLPDAILQKPGKFEPEEYEIMKTHAANGGKLLKDNMGMFTHPLFMQLAWEVATYHHERWDGTGYPEGRRGLDIPLSARIMIIADVFDALIFQRSYKPAFAYEKAFNIMEEESGSFFEPRLLEVFLEDKEELRILGEKLRRRE